MEVLKSLEEIGLPDPRHAKRHAPDIEWPEEHRPPDLADLHREMAALELPESVPETLRSAFAVARNLWIYGWFFWPFHTLASWEAVRCIEIALRVKCEDEGLFGGEGAKRRTRVTLKWLLDQALEKRWIEDAGFRNFHRLQRGESTFFLPPGTIVQASQREPITSDPQSYSRMLATSLRVLRNRRAHPDRHMHSVPDWGRLDLEFAHDVIAQLFPAPASPSPKE